jgi:hypothetical protein
VLKYDDAVEVNILFAKVFAAAAGALLVARPD